jgi:molecular chaperone DnaJ
MATAQRDYYEVLGVSRDADEKAIRDAFRALALKYHPDRNKEPGAEERFKEIAEAYAVLSDPKKRAEYDRGGIPFVAGFRPEDLLGGIDFEGLFGGLGFDFGTDRLFDRFFGRRRAEGPPRGENLEVLLEVPLERVLHGGEESVQVGRPGPCPACGGSGAKAGTSPRTCDRCGGSGRLVTTRQEPGVSVQQITTCAACHGQGVVIDEPCLDCMGRGAVETTETLTVTIPVGVEEGMALRLEGRGLPSRAPGGRPGDLYVIVRTRADPRFERHGDDLWHTVALEVADAVLGTSLEVPTLERPATISVPPGTQPETVFRLAGQGLPRFDGGRGDLLVRIGLHVPDELLPEERALYEQLRELGARASRRRRC